MLNVKHLSPGCCGEVRVGFSSQPVLGKQLSLRDFPEQSNRNEGRRERVWGEGNWGRWFPLPNDAAHCSEPRLSHLIPSRAEKALDPVV